MKTTLKHTPGPWHVRNPENMGIYGSPQQVQHMDGEPKQSVVCTMARNRWLGRDCSHSTEDRANAALIASAPDLLVQRDELLAACRLARGQLQSAADWARTEHREDGATRAFDACCAAISKAERGGVKHE